MLNFLPIVGQAIQLVAEVLFSGLRDSIGQRLPFVLLHSVRHYITHLGVERKEVDQGLGHQHSFLMYLGRQPGGPAPSHDWELSQLHRSVSKTSRNPITLSESRCFRVRTMFLCSCASDHFEYINVAQVWFEV